MNTKLNSPIESKWHFDFIVQTNRELMEELLDIIIDWHDEHGLEMGGGFYLEQEGDNVQEESE